MSDSPKEAPAVDPLTDSVLLDRLAADASLIADPNAPAPVVAPEPDLPTADLVAMVLAPAFALLAPNWNIKPDEVQQLSGVYAALLDKYFPDLQTQFGVELGAVLVTAVVFMPRVVAGKPRKLEEKPAQAA